MRPVPITLALLVLQAVAHAAPPDYGFSWKTVGAPGNRPASQAEAPFIYPPLTDPPQLVGSVNYEYRMMTTAVTARQYLPFVQQYWRYYPGQIGSTELTSLWIQPTSTTPQGEPVYTIFPGYEDSVVEVGWRTSAVFANWLHNGRVNAEWAFKSGAYDTSTFSTDPKTGVFTDQATRSPSATFWIPSLDEWTKGMYYDPNRYGPNQDGYWLYPHSSQEPAITGFPEQGGQTSAGLGFPGQLVPAGSYPWAASPWGLLDGSGGAPQWLEDIEPGNIGRLLKGSGATNSVHQLFDRVDWTGYTSSINSGRGIRIASVIPGPSSTLIFLMISCFGIFTPPRRIYR